MRGPIGGWFVWDGETPALLVAGGFGVVPFIAMLRHARALGREDLLRIAVSSRTLAELPYAEELMAAGALIVLTREAHGIRPAGRLTAGELVPLWEPGQTAYVCGSASFAESASRLLVDLGCPEPRAGRAVRPERPRRPEPGRSRNRSAGGPRVATLPPGLDALGGDGHGRRRRAPTGPAVADRGAPRVDPGLPPRPPAAHAPPGHDHRRPQLAGGAVHGRSRARAASRSPSRCRTAWAWPATATSGGRCACSPCWCRSPPRC